jgi:integrase
MGTLQHDITMENPFDIPQLYKGTCMVKKEGYVPTKEELKALLRWVQNINYKYKNHLFLIFKYLFKYGARIGSFSNMEVKGNKAFFTSKGKECLTPFIIDDKDIKGFKAMLKFVKPKKPKAFNTWINRYLEKAFDEGLILQKITSHKPRHFFADERLMEGVPSIQVSRELNHRSPTSINPYVSHSSKVHSDFMGIPLLL